MGVYWLPFYVIVVFKVHIGPDEEPVRVVRRRGFSVVVRKHRRRSRLDGGQKGLLSILSLLRVSVV